MSTTITDKYKYSSSAGIADTALANQVIYAVPASSIYRVKDSGGVYRLLPWNPNITSSAARYGISATTDANGQFSFVLPQAAADTKPTTAQWTILFPDGSTVTGVVPAVAGPLTVDDLITTYSWTQGNAVYVAPTTPGTLARGTAVFTAATSVAILFTAPFAASTYNIKLSPSIDSSTSNVPTVGWSSKSTTGFTINTTGVFTGSVDWQADL